MRKLVVKYGAVFASVALFVGKISTSAVCRYCFHQPEVPEKLKDI